MWLSREHGDLYRIDGGLALSTIFTLFVIPALLVFVIGFEKARPDQNGA